MTDPNAEMSDRMKEIEKVIQKAALDGALTEDAITLFHGTIQSEKEMAESLKESEHNLEMSVKARDALRQERDDARSVRDVLLSEQKSVEEREKAITVLEMTASNATQRVEDHKNMMTLIFKPGEIRRNAWSSVPGFDQNGYCSGNTGNANEDSTEHDE